MGMNTIEWDVDPTGLVHARHRGDLFAGCIREPGPGPGSIILMHDGGGPRSGTLAALPQVIDTLRNKGYSFATVPDLLGFAAGLQSSR